jgi:hypothetical protein
MRRCLPESDLSPLQLVGPAMVEMRFATCTGSCWHRRVASTPNPCPASRYYRRRAGSRRARRVRDAAIQGPPIHHPASRRRRGPGPGVGGKLARAGGSAGSPQPIPGAVAWLGDPTSASLPPRLKR